MLEKNTFYLLNARLHFHLFQRREKRRLKTELQTNWLQVLLPSSRSARCTCLSRGFLTKASTRGAAELRFLLGPTTSAQVHWWGRCQCLWHTRGFLRQTEWQVAVIKLLHTTYNWSKIQIFPGTINIHVAKRVYHLLTTFWFGILETLVNTFSVSPTEFKDLLVHRAVASAHVSLPCLPCSVGM